MNRLLTVLVQEYLSKVRTKAFILGTLLLPLFMGIVTVLPALFMSMKVNEGGALVVVDQTGELFAPFSRAVGDSSARELRLTLEPIGGRSQDEVVQGLQKRVAEEEIGGFLLFPADAVDGGKTVYYARNVSDFERNERLEGAVERAIREVRVGRAKLDPVQVREILKETPFTTFKVSRTGEAAEDKGRTFGLAYFMGLVFYITQFIYGTMMLRIVLEEKTSRSAEVMVSIVRPEELMAGKILGVALMALTQMAIWGLLIFGFAAYGGAMSGVLGDAAKVIGELGFTPALFGAFLLYFLLGFFFYAAIFGSIGAMVSSESEAQQIQTPVSMPIVLAFMLMFLAIRDPNGLLIRVASLIPFFTPILMTVRLCVVPPATWEIGLSVAIMVGSTAIVLWAAGRVFRVGLLMYGKRPNLPELLRWIRQA